MEAPTYPRIEGFKGINNRVDPIRLGLEWQLQASNCLCDDAGFLTRRPGQVELVNGDYIDIHGMRDGRLLAINSSNELVQIDMQGNETVLHMGITGAPFQWAELGYAIFLMSASGMWAIYPHSAIVWGSICPASPATIYPLGDPISYPPPVGNVIGVRRDQLAIAVWEDDKDRSVVYFSRPGFPHEFRLERDYEIFAGRVTLLIDTSSAFIITTDKAVYTDSYEAPLARVAGYGGVMGGWIYDEREIAWFWTGRGLCKATPFENLTDKQLAVVSRRTITGALLMWQGSQYAIIQQNGKIADKQTLQPYAPTEVSGAGIATLNWPELVLQASS